MFTNFLNAVKTRRKRGRNKRKFFFLNEANALYLVSGQYCTCTCNIIFVDETMYSVSFDSYHSLEA